MRALAGFIVAGWYQAILAIVLSTLLSYLAPPLTSILGYGGAAALALYSLHEGPRSGAIVMLLAALLLGLLAELVLGQGLAVVVVSLLLWVPVWLAALVLRMTASPAAVMLVLTSLAMSVALLVFVLPGDSASWWLRHLQGMVDAVVTQQELAVDRQALDEFMQQVAPLMTGILAAALTFAALTCVVVGRWWQAMLVNPGGLRKEFYALRLNRHLSLFGIALIGLAAFAPGGAGTLALQGALIIAVPFLFVGLAVIHASLANLGASKAWLIGTYILMSLLPQVLMMVMVAGALDPWLDLRQRTATKLN
ncbi:MAG: DUF2232 domain-containing protein [Thiogranum sp.]|nr:DUF2232 domain-containing protein [Thiogranum sp.]